MKLDQYLKNQKKTAIVIIGSIEKRNSKIIELKHVYRTEREAVVREANSTIGKQRIGTREPKT